MDSNDNSHDALHMSMEKDALKRTAVVLIAVVIILMFVSIPVCYALLDMEPIALAILAAFYITLAAAMAYYAHERLKEIDEGLDDAVDDY